MTPEQFQDTQGSDGKAEDSTEWRRNDIEKIEDMIDSDNSLLRTAKFDSQSINWMIWGL